MAVEISIWEFFIALFVQAFIVAIAIKKFVPDHFKIIGPVVLWRSKRWLDEMDRLSRRWPRVWKAYGDFSIVLAFGLVGALYVFRKESMLKRGVFSLGSAAIIVLLNPILPTDAAFLAVLFLFGYSAAMTYILASSAFNTVAGYVTNVPVKAAVAPAVPGVNIRGSPFQIPWYGWLAFPPLLAFHELSHGVLARFMRVRLKNLGIAMLGLFPVGAFVDPDEKQLRRGAVHSQMRVFGVGSAANYLQFLGILAAIIIVIAPVLDAVDFAEKNDEFLDHPVIGAVSSESDAVGKLEPGMRIISINGTEVRGVSDVRNATQALGAGTIAEIVTDKGVFLVRLDKDARIGISNLQNTYRDDRPPALALTHAGIDLLGITMFFNLIVGLMNLLPMRPFDGGHLFEAFLSTRMRRKDAKRVTNWMTVAIAAVFLLNILPLFFPNY